VITSGNKTQVLQLQNMVTYLREICFTRPGGHGEIFFFAHRETAMGKNNMRLKKISLARQG
jgi:hypothetical protein